MFKKLFVVAVLAALPGTVLALGFGDITVFSKLNEPLKVHIELLDSNAVPVDEVTVKNASLSTYRRSNLPKPDVFNKVRFKTSKLSNGTIIAVLTTKAPVKEPFITFIADLRWRSGHLNREYTFLLDPPEFVLKNTRTPSSKAAKAVQNAPDTQVKSTSFSKKSKKTSPGIDHSAVIAAHVGTQTYKTKQADTLWDIAKRLKPDNRVTTYQTMQALFAFNPNAFINANINLLKQKQTLKVPTVDEILQINGKLPVSKTSLKATTPSIASQTALKKQQPIEKLMEQPSDNIQEQNTSATEKDGELKDEAHLKIIPPTEELLNKPVANQEDLKLIKKALKTSIDTIQLLHNENESLAAKINELTDKLNSLDSHNEKLNSQINEISTLLKDKQSLVSSSSKPVSETVGETISKTRLTDNSQSPVEEPITIAINSDVGKTRKSRSFVRELLTSPVITFALAIFTVIILVAVLFTIRKQNEKRKQRKQNSYIPFSEIEQSRSVQPEETVKNNNNTTTKSEPVQTEKNTEPKQQKSEEEMDFFEYFEKKINAPDESSQENNETTSPSKSTETNESEVSFSLDITEQEIQDYEKHITQSYKQSKNNLPDTAISEIDTYIAYGNYNTAEEIILREIQNAPANKNLHLKLFECYSLNNKRYEFMQHIKKIINILNIDMVLRHRIETIYQQTWNETLNINKFT